MNRSRRAAASRNERGSARDRRRRREWLLETWPADVTAVEVTRCWGDQGDEVFIVSSGNPTMTIAAYENECFVGDGWESTTARAVPVCRCWRCGTLLSITTLTVDRIIPGCRGGTYRRTNIRPACEGCNRDTGQPAAIRGKP